MSSAFGGLNTTARGLMSQQIALNTVGHNISNANTDGYSRQSVALVTSAPELRQGSYGQLQIGTGTDTQSITRARDTFMDQQMWKENPTLSYAQSQENMLSQVEDIISISSDTGIQTTLNNFWSSWQTLGSNASSDSTRNQVLQRGTELANTIQNAASQLKEMVASTNGDLKLDVQKVNQITSEILSLNKKISVGENGGSGSANDLRDRRDLLVDQLSGYVNISVTEDADGSYNIQSGAVTLVNSTNRTELTTVSRKDPDYGYEVLDIQANGVDVAFSNGSLQGKIDMRDDADTGVKSYMNQLSTMSEFLLRDFNAIHRAGFGEDNLSGRNFFGDASTNYTASTYSTPSQWLAALKVNPDLLNQDSATPGLQMIAAKTLSTQGNASGDNATKLSQALRSNTTSLLPAGYTPTLGSTASLNSYFSNVVGTLGIRSQSTSSLVDNQQTLVDQIESWRQSTSGVNLDEEMTNMIKFQRGYNASARMLTTMDELLDKLINSTGTVGR